MRKIVREYWIADGAVSRKVRGHYLITEIHVVEANPCRVT